MIKNVFILTGDKQTGKTTFLKNWVATQRNVAGILTPIVNDKRCFYDIAAQDFYVVEVDFNQLPAQEVLTIGKYIFSLKSFEKAAETLMYQCVDANVAYFVIDEIGPLELKQHKGFYNALLYVAQNLYEGIQMIIVARGESIEALQKLLHLFHKPSSIFTVERLKLELANEVSGAE